MREQSGYLGYYMQSKVRSQARQSKTMKHGLLNFQQICGIDNAQIVISLARGVFAVERKMESAKRHCVEHVGFHPMKSCVVWGWKHWCYMKLEVIRANWVGRCGTQWNNRTKTATLTQARRNDDSRTTFHHLRGNKPGEVANDNSPLLRMELDSHDLFYRHKSEVPTNLDAERSS